MKIVFSIFLILFMNITSAQNLKIMTYNIRYNNPKDGDNSWTNRKETLIHQILFYEPDIIGTQEGLEDQIADLDKELTAYTFSGIPRADVKEGRKGEYSAIFYKKNQFKKMESGTFWLSETPEKPSRGWDASLNRICTYIRLKDLKSGKSFWVFNTHLDHKGIAARKKSTALIIKKVKEINNENLPFFLTGDFNSEPEDQPIKILTRAFNDAYTVCQTPVYGPYGTFNGFDTQKKEYKKRIDYIFTGKSNIIIKKYAVLAEINDLKFPSDHFPVFVIAEMK